MNFTFKIENNMKFNFKNEVPENIENNSGLSHSVSVPINAINGEFFMIEEDSE